MRYLQWKFFISPAIAALLSIIALLVNFLVQPYDLIVFHDDPNLQFPYLSNTVPMWTLYLLAVATFVIVLLYSGFVKHDWNEVILAFYAWITTVSLDWFLITTIKIYTGRPRPNFKNNPNPTSARVSFPSGHAGFSFAIFHLLSLWILSKFRDRKLPARYNLAIMLFSMSPQLIAIWISITRIHDYHHHYSDVIAGALFGIAAARIGYYSFLDSRVSVDSDEW